MVAADSAAKSAWFGVVTLLPDMITAALSDGVVGRAVQAGIIEVALFNPRTFTADRHRTVDDQPYGGGPGMVMMAAPVVEAIAAARKASPTPECRVVLLDPAGQRFVQDTAQNVADAAGRESLILVCGRYEGIDERLLEVVDECWSLGDFVLSGGELGALAVVDAVSRLVPGTLGNSASKMDESHLDGMLEYPHYTRPEILASGARVPEVLLSGDHRRIGQYRRRQALGKTYDVRPDLLVRRVFDERDRQHMQAWLAGKQRQSETKETQHG